MATYYVRPDGNDTNTGLAPTNTAGTGAWRTVNKALSVAVGGDTVWIAPGVYRENVSPTVAAQATDMFVRGDATLTQVAWGSGLTAGQIRITNIPTNDSGAASGVTLTLNNIGKYNFFDIRFEGKISLYIQGNTTFTDCTFIGNGTESGITTRGNGVSADTLTFDRCITSNLPINYSTQNNNITVAHRIVWVNCLHYVCTNSERASITGPGGTVSGFWHSWSQTTDTTGPACVYFNNTFVGGKDTPAHLIVNFGWGASTNPYIKNCLFLITPTTATLRSDRGQISENYNAGIPITRTNVGAGANSINLNTYPVDIGEAYLQGFANYAPFTPFTSSLILAAGNNGAVAGINAPTTDFSGNLWNQVNPTIGYMENRAIALVPGTGGYVPLDRAVQTITTTAGSTGVSVHVYLGSTGVTFQTPNLTCYYARDNGASVQIPLVQGNASTWVSGGLFEVSSTTMPGVYKFDIPNAVIQAGAKSASIMLRGANAFNGAFVNVNIEAEPQPNYVSTNEFKLKSEDAGYNNVLELNSNTATTVKLQLLDMYQTPTNLTSSTLSVEVYNSTNNLVATYTPTVRYAGNGEITFVISTDVTATYGDYNVYCVKTTGATDSVVYGPLALKVRRL